MIRNRSDLAKANRVLIKAGTSIISTPDGYPSLTRMANIVEYAAQLAREGKEVMIVTSGAVGVGRQRLKKQVIIIFNYYLPSKLLYNSHATILH